MKKTIIIPAIPAACSPLFSVAQDAASVPAQIQREATTEPCFKVKRISTELTAVPQRERIEVKLRMESTACKVVYRQRQNHDSAEGLSLAASSPFRLVSGSTAYGKLSQEDASLRSPATAQKIDYQLVIEALPDTPVGKQNVDATMRFQVTDGNGNLEWREQPVAIPLEVVAAGAHVHKTAGAKFKEVAELTGLVLLTIALSPLLIVMGIVNGPGSC